MPYENSLKIEIEIPGNVCSNEVQLIAALEKVTDILLDEGSPDYIAARGRVALWYFERYGPKKE